MICDYKCHQDSNEKTNCGTCNNTGVIIPFDQRDSFDMIPLEQKPIFVKGEKDMSNFKIISDLG